MNKSIIKHKFKKYLVIIFFLIFVIIISTAFLYFTNLRRTPKYLTIDSYQRPSEDILSNAIEKFDYSIIGNFIDEKIIKIILDNPTEKLYSLIGIEVNNKNFPKINNIIKDCSNILYIEKPRTFIVNNQETNAYVLNAHKPILIINSGLLKLFENENELRYILGHELGHIKSRHVKIKVLINVIIKPLPNILKIGALLPFAYWIRESEMSADNAGLICVQNLKYVESAMLRAVSGIKGKINVDEYMNQIDDNEKNFFSDTIFMLNQILNTHPFIYERIKQIREYEQSNQYKSIFE